MSKKIVVIIIGVFLIVVVFFYFIKQTGAPKETSPLPVKPSIPNYLKGSINVNSSVARENFVFPEKLPLVLIEKTATLTEDQVLQTATKAGFLSKNYIVADDLTKGKTYIFREKGESLTVYTKEGGVVYVSGSTPSSSSVSISDENLISTAEVFLKEKFFSENEGLYFSSIYYLREEEEGFSEVERSSANVFKVNFSPIDSKIKFVEINPLGSIISVWLDPLGQIIKSEVKKVSQARFSLEEVPIKSYDEFITTLYESIIVSLGDGSVFPGDLPEGAVQNINIKNVEVVYFSGTGSENFFQPVFLLKGDAEVKSFGLLPVTLYLPAIKGL